MLGKPLGVGVMSAALKKQRLGEDGYGQMIANTTKLTTEAPPGRAARRVRAAGFRPHGFDQVALIGSIATTVAAQGQKVA